MRVPQTDGEVWLAPDPSAWRDLAARAHHEAPRRDLPRLLGVPLRDARHLARRALPRLLGPEADPDVPWVATGHQTTLFHPGVWAKGVAAHAVAQQLGGAGLFVNVDHDAPRRGPQLRWPALDARGRLTARGALPFDGVDAFERVDAPTTAALRQLLQRVDAETAAVRAPGGEAALALIAPEASERFGRWFARARAALDQRLGVALTECLASELCETDAFLLFVADALADAEGIHRAYNTAARGVLPPLRGSADALELPFWAPRVGAPGRPRLIARRTSGGIALAADGHVLGVLSPHALASADRAPQALRALLRDAGAGIRPRAVTLTLFVRAAVADLFVHGLGGAVYDQVTDRLYAARFGAPPPPFAVATATMRLPLATPTTTDAAVRAARDALRRVEQNPAHGVDAEDAPAELRAILAARSVAAANASLLRARRDPAGRAARALNHQQIVAANAALTARFAARTERLRADLDALLALRDETGVALDRDYFYGLHPTARLEGLRDTVRRSLERPDDRAAP